MIGCLIGAMLVMTLFPETAAARTLKRFLVDLPLQRAMDLDRRQILFAFVFVALIVLAGETVMLFGSVDLTVVYAWDLSLYVDAILAASALVVSSRTAGLRTAARAKWLQFRRPVGRRPRERRTRSLAAPPANDDDADGISQIFAVAA